MAGIFISYSKKDRAWVKKLVDALTAEGWEVWWDLKIRSGQSFDRVIERTLSQVQCVVTLWSKNSVDSDWVRAEAAWAKDHNKLVAVRIEDNVKLPIQFYHVHTEPIVRWRGSREAAPFRKLVEDIQAIAGAPQPITKTSSGGSASASVRGVKAESGIARTARVLRLLSNFRDPMRVGGEGPEMVAIPAGSFWMGSTKDAQEHCRNNELPIHRVKIPWPFFALSRTAITFADYDLFAKVTGRDEPINRGWGRAAGAP